MFRTPILVERVSGEAADETGFAPPVTENGRRTGRSSMDVDSGSSEELAEILVLFPPSVAIVPTGSRLTLPEGEENRVCYVTESRAVFMRDNTTLAYRAYEIT
ncbi:hypothetical protein [Rhodococcoides fascians]|uniref:hypothetical protein n=1 Tax=Rhodococcoides fascians TaxID=1828 RepID=UPI000A418F6E|nr:hypothetical protein [Rhodococcus fascians]